MGRRRLRDGSATRVSSRIGRFRNLTQVAIIGAGPYGLSIAAHLGAQNISYRIFGTPLDTWRNHMPAGMSLRSHGFSSTLPGPGPTRNAAAHAAGRGVASHAS